MVGPDRQPGGRHSHGLPRLAGPDPACGLAAYGAEGAQRALDILRAELGLTLGQIGCPVVTELGPRYLWNPALTPTSAG